jgi:hypothetical protein
MYGSIKYIDHKNKQKTNSMALARKRTIPTERQPLVGEVIADFADRGVANILIAQYNISCQYNYEF